MNQESVMRFESCRLSAVFGLVGALAFAASTASATVLTFDDIAPVLLDTIPDGYGGLNWSTMGFLNSTAPTTGGYPGGTVSGEFVAFNEDGQVGSVGGVVFDFNSAYLAAAWNNGLSVTVRGFLLGVEIYSQTVGVTYSTIPGASATLFNFNFLGVDQLTFQSFGGVDADLGDGGGGPHFSMDNFTFNQAAAVPEPSTLLCAGLGLVALSRMKRS